MSDMDVEAFKFAISQPGALTAALNYYRNVGTLYLEDDWLKDGQARITSPTLIVWVRCYKMSVIAFVEFTGGGGGVHSSTIVPILGALFCVYMNKV